VALFINRLSTGRRVVRFGCRSPWIRPGKGGGCPGVLADVSVPVGRPIGLTPGQKGHTIGTYTTKPRRRCNGPRRGRMPVQAAPSGRVHDTLLRLGLPPGGLRAAQLARPYPRHGGGNRDDHRAGRRRGGGAHHHRHRRGVRVPPHRRRPAPHARTDAHHLSQLGRGGLARGPARDILRGPVRATAPAGRRRGRCLPHTPGAGP
jgi:hypothetical protein